MSKTRAIIVGAVESSLVALEAIAAHPDWTLAGVVTLDPAHQSRHSDFVDLVGPAQRTGAAIIHADNVNHPSTLAAIAAIEPDYVFVIGWSQICGAAFRELAPDRMVGYHPAALPRLRGRAAIPWTILNNEAITAGTLFFIDGGTDTGAVIDQAFFHVAPDETATTLYAKHMDALRSSLARALPLLARGEAPRQPQDDACATWAARRTPEDGRVDWDAPAEDVLRLIRASSRPYPGAFTMAGESALRLWRAHLAPDGARHLARPGQVIDVTTEGITIMCGNRAAIIVNDWSGIERPPRRHVQLGRGA